MYQSIEERVRLLTDNLLLLCAHGERDLGGMQVQNHLCQISNPRMGINQSSRRVYKKFL